MAAVSVTDETFEQEVLKSELPVVVDFWASWCGPCQMMGPVVEELSDELEGKVKFCKVNVDDNPELAQNYDVMSIPNFKLFKNGEMAGEQVGAVGKDGLLSLIG
ncbi:MAG: thioredoxin [Treponema sp.]|nr:thioredoxin [Treponema sp.]MBP5752856.1 thioredoxin [Treponema sp.]